MAIKDHEKEIMVHGNCHGILHNTLKNSATTKQITKDLKLNRNQREDVYEVTHKETGQI